MKNTKFIKKYENLPKMPILKFWKKKKKFKNRIFFFLNLPALEMTYRFVVEAAKMKYRLFGQTVTRSTWKCHVIFLITYIKRHIVFFFFLVEMTSLKCRKWHVVFAKKKRSKNDTSFKVVFFLLQGLFNLFRPDSKMTIRIPKSMVTNQELQEI